MSKSKGTILIVDDERPVRNALNRLLRSAGYECLLFSCGDELFTALPYNKPGCILLDLKLSETSGLDVQADLCRLDNTLPVIFMSGYGSIKDTVEAMRYGAVNFLTKPVEDDELLSVIDDAVDLHCEKLKEYRRVQVSRQLYAKLSVREKEVMRFVISGARIKNISAHLGIAEKTVKIHKARIMRKMQAESVVDLYQQATLIKVYPDAVS